MTLSALFDPPVSAPTPPGPFLPFLQPYVTGQVPARLAGQPLLKLAVQLTRQSEAEAEALIEFGVVWLNDRPCFDPAQKLNAEDSFRLNPPAYGPQKFYKADPGRIIYEDEDALVYNKESGRPSQAVPHDAHNNILAALLSLIRQRDGQGRNLWLTHRLDADTSGLLLFAKNKNAAAVFGRAFQRGEIEKQYLCLSSSLSNSVPEANFTARGPIAKKDGRYVVALKGPGLAARTDFQLLDQDSDSDAGRPRFLFLAKPKTGRTHQIRLHLTHAGYPIIGDRFYQGRPAARLMLMSAALHLAGRLSVQMPGLPYKV